MSAKTDSQPPTDIVASAAISAEQATLDTVEIERVVEGLKTVADAAQLETALVDVKPGVGSSRERRKLKRTLEQVLSRAEVEQSMNAKVRRRVTRVLSFLAPNPNAREEQQAAEAAAKAQAAAAAASEVAQRQQAINSSGKSGSKVPYVVFVGQLSYSTTANDLKAFFESQGVNGSIKVRLLSNSSDGSSRGMAFVELENAVEMHKCIALHRSVLHAKMINIEKSCGGSANETRTEKLRQKRGEQAAKLQETVVRIIAEYTKSNVINPEKFGSEFKTKLLSCGPAIISKV